jgi:hypothetical protein
VARGHNEGAAPNVNQWLVFQASVRCAGRGAWAFALQDALYDPLTDSLRALPAYSAYVGYERLWKATFTSVLTYGLVRVSNLDAQPGDALRETQRGPINLTWTPISQLDLVLELLTARRVNRDGAQGPRARFRQGGRSASEPTRALSASPGSTSLRAVSRCPPTFRVLHDIREVSTPGDVAGSRMIVGGTADPHGVNVA